MFKRIKQSRAAAGDGGFTLIELLVVIVILGILAAVVVFAVGGVGDKGQTAACKIDTRTLRTAEEAYSAQPTPGGGGGNYVASDGSKSEAALVNAGFLSESSEYHYVSAVVSSSPGPASFKIYVQDTRCGTPDGEVGTTGNL